MISKPLSDITETDISALVENSVAEDRTLDFKEELPGPRGDDAHEFLADVTSFANTDGGDIIYGIREEDGMAAEACGAPLPVPLDDVLGRLESLLRDGVEPRLSGCRFHVVKHFGGAVVLMLRVPASFAAPHRVILRGGSKFYHRNSRGKAPMDTHELRIAFTSTESYEAKFKELREETVEQILNRDLPFGLRAGPRAITSIMPLGMLRDRHDLTLDHVTCVWPPVSGSNSWLHALEGFYIYQADQDDGTDSYALTRRSGQIDATWVIGREIDPGGKVIWPELVEAGLGRVAANAAERLGFFGIEGPFGVALTLTGVRSYTLYTNFFDPWHPVVAWRDRFNIPIAVVEHLTNDALLPIARGFWFAMGVERPDKPLGMTRRV